MMKQDMQISLENIDQRVNIDFIVTNPPERNEERFQIIILNLIQLKNCIFNNMKVLLSTLHQYLSPLLYQGYLLLLRKDKGR